MPNGQGIWSTRTRTCPARACSVQPATCAAYPRRRRTRRKATSEVVSLSGTSGFSRPRIAWALPSLLYVLSAVSHSLSALSYNQRSHISRPANHARLKEQITMHLQERGESWRELQNPYNKRPTRATATTHLRARPTALCRRLRVPLSLGHSHGRLRRSHLPRVALQPFDLRL